MASFSGVRPFLFLSSLQYNFSSALMSAFLQENNYSTFRSCAWMILGKPVSAVFTFPYICQMVGWAILARCLALAFHVPGKKRAMLCRQASLKTFIAAELQLELRFSCSELIRLSSKCLSAGCITNNGANICCRELCTGTELC